MITVCEVCGIQFNNETAKTCPPCKVEQELNTIWLDFHQKELESLQKAKSPAEFIKQLPPNTFEKCRRADVVRLRAWAIIQLRDRYKYSWPSIGNVFDYSDHTTAIHLYQRFRKPDEKERLAYLIHV